MKIRPYQEEAIARVLALFSQGVRRVLLVLPTGGGKTVVASEIVRRAARRTLFLAHRRELVKQAFCKLARNGLSASDVGVIMSGVDWRVDRELGAVDPAHLDDEDLWKRWARRRPPATTQVGSIDTFRNKTPPASGLVIIDEAHRALSASYQAVQKQYPDAWHLGLTATPFRADGKGLEEAYDEIVVAASYGELVAEGFLVEPRCYGSPKKVDLSSVKKSRGDYNEKDLAQAVDTKELVGDIVEHWQRLGNNAPTFCFGVNVAHSKHLRDRFLEAGIAAEHIDGETDTAIRDAAFRKLRAGEIKILCNCDVATEGTDVPCVKTIILARPTLSERIYLQQVGRGSRPFDGRPFVVLDHAGCCVEFGLPQEPREYSLEGRKKKAKKDAALAPAKDCPQCFAIVPMATHICEGCGYEFPAATVEDPPKEKDGQLVELTETQRSRVREWNDLANDWKWQNFLRAARGERVWKPGAILQAWKQKTGLDLPPKGAKYPKLTEEEKAHNADVEANDRRYQRSKDRRTRNAERLAGGM